MKILHVISSLGVGGCEKILYEVCKNDYLNRHVVVNLSGGGKYSGKIMKLNIEVYSLNINIKKNFLSIFYVFHLLKILYSVDPHVVQTWMYHANFIGGFAAKIANVKKIFWNIRGSNLEIRHTKFLTLILVKILAKLSYYIPTIIINCSKKSIKYHKTIGYNKKIFFYIPNGYDLSYYKKVSKKKFFIRKNFDLKKNIPLIGIVGRDDPVKDYSNFLKAISIIKNIQLEFNVIFVGTNLVKENYYLSFMIDKLNLNNHVILLGYQEDIPLIMSELDILVLSSSSEGFPNVVAEAMACKTPCIVTNVGDASAIVSNSGWVVPIKNPKILAKAINIAINEFNTKSWTTRCNYARAKIVKNFSIDNMIQRYNYIWNK